MMNQTDGVNQELEAKHQCRDANVETWQLDGPRKESRSFYISADGVRVFLSPRCEHHMRVRFATLHCEIGQFWDRESRLRTVFVWTWPQHPQCHPDVTPAVLRDAVARLRLRNAIGSLPPIDASDEEKSGSGGKTSRKVVREVRKLAWLESIDSTSTNSHLHGERWIWDEQWAVVPLSPHQLPLWMSRWPSVFAKAVVSRLGALQYSYLRVWVDMTYCGVWTVCGSQCYYRRCLQTRADR